MTPDSNPNSPAISVVIPVYNRADLIERAVGSVLRQSFPDFELLVVDDASTDATRDRVIAINDPRIRLISLEKNGGNAVARNNGARAAKGRLVAFLDSDDEYEPDALRQIHDALDGTAPDVGFAWGGIIQVRDTPEGSVEVQRRSWSPSLQGTDRYTRFLRQLNMGTAWGVAIKRECFDAVGYFDERLRAAVDKEFLLRLVREFSYIVVPAYLVRMHAHEGERVRTDVSRRANAYDIMLAEHQAALMQDRTAWCNMHYKAGWLHCYAGDKRTGRKHLRKVLQRNPLSVRAWAALIGLGLFGGSKVFDLHTAMSVRNKRSKR